MTRTTHFAQDLSLRGSLETWIACLCGKAFPGHYWDTINTVRGSFHEETKERKGLGTSPFGTPGLTPYPHPLCFSCLSGSIIRRTWRVADVPGVQGELLPAGAWGSAPHLPIIPFLQSPKPLCPLLFFFVLFVVKTHWQSCVR